MMRTKLLLFSLLFPLLAYAQLEETQVVITDGVNNALLKGTIEKNISHFLIACNEAVMNGDKPKTKALTDDARKALNAMWKMSPMSCPVSKIEEICLETPDGYQVRNIPVSMMAVKTA